MLGSLVTRYAGRGAAKDDSAPNSFEDYSRHGGKAEHLILSTLKEFNLT